MPLPPNSAVQSFWASHFYAFQWREHGAVAPGIITELYRLRDLQQRNIASGIAEGAKSGEGIHEGDFDLLRREHEGLVRLRQFIVQSVQQTVAHVNSVDFDPSQLSVDICDSWFHITNHGGFHDSHYHGQCSWCGIYYVQAGESGRRVNKGAPNGGNRFYSPLWSGGSYEDFGNRYQTHTYVDPPVSDGMLLLFPSFLMHSALPYTGSQDRIIISVNTRTHRLVQEK